MKNSKEILDTVLKMRDEHYERKRRRKAIMLKLSALVSAAAVLIIVLGINAKTHTDIKLPEIDIAENIIVTTEPSTDTSIVHTTSLKTAIKTTHTTSVSSKTETYSTVSETVSQTQIYTERAAYVNEYTFPVQTAETAYSSEITETVVMDITDTQPVPTETTGTENNGTEITVVTDLGSQIDVDKDNIDFVVIIDDNNRRYVSIGDANNFQNDMDNAESKVIIIFTEKNYVLMNIDGVDLMPYCITDEEKEYYRQTFTGSETDENN